MSAIPDPAPARERLPSGTVTFAFTDIEGSTQRWEHDRAAMQDAVRRHDAVMRSVIAEHNGYVFKTIGDAFCASFWRAEDAIAALLDAQRALAAEDFAAVEGLRIRAAVHTGTADERDGDYFGPTVNRVARLLAIGHGGQVLVSGVTSDLVQGTLPPHASLRDLGEHRLKDLSRPEYVYQLLAPGLETEFPALRSLDALPNNLPRMPTSFIGRETEVAEITALLEAHQLVTLIGSGGIGKTRTSLQVAANLLDGSGDGVWFIELAPLKSGDYIPSTVAQAFGLTLASDGDAVDNLARALKTKDALLVFDNCEHLVESTARVLATLARGCPNVKILASSRQSLGIAGEQTYRLPSLEVPVDGRDGLTASAAGQCAAIALFVERARAVDKRFTLTDDNAPILADICRRLDGIPLAIELAAARVKMLSARQLRERLDARFRVLTGGSRDALPRQQTLRALIDWSHDLLDERERALFRRLGIFVNGFTLEGAVAVISAGDAGVADAEPDEFAVFDVLASLVDKSLVLAEPDGDSLRYRLLESTRLYAAEKLAAAGERDAAASRHLRYLRDRFAAAWERWDRTARGAELSDTLGIELEDVRAALDWAAGSSDAVIGGELLAKIADRWKNVGLENEGLARIETFFGALSEGESRLLGRLWIAVSYLTLNSGRKARAFEAATRAVAHARIGGEAFTLADALRQYSFCASTLGELDEANAALVEAEAIPGAPVRLRMGLLQSRALVSHGRGDFATTARAFEGLRKEYRSLGNGPAERSATLNLADIEHAGGQTRHATELVREALPALRAHGDRQILVNGLANLAGYLTATGDLPGACTAAREAIRELAPREPASAMVAIATEHLALAIALGGDFARAAALAGYADSALERHGFQREFTERTTHDRLTSILRERVAPDELARWLADGAALTSEVCITLALEDT